MILFRMTLRVVLAPREAFAELARTAPRNVGMRVMLTMALLWALLLLVFAFRGHAPSGPLLLPVDRAGYYGWEAAFIVPIQLLMWWAMSAVLHGLSRRAGGTGSASLSRAVAGLSVAVPYVLVWLLPDAIVYAAAGFDALGVLVRVTAPLCLLWALVLTTLGVGAVHGVSGGRAFGIALVSLIVYVAIGAPVLR